MVNTIILNQFFGCGDIIFCQSIANRLAAKGAKIIWPVMECYAPMAKHFPNVTMIDKALLNIDYMRRDNYEINGCQVIPLRFSDSLCEVEYKDCMKSKYMLMNMDWTDWKKDCIIKRDQDSEIMLYEEVLNLKEGEQYNLISEQFSTGGARTRTIEVDNGLRNIKMEIIDGFTAIDWLYVMQKATTIHMVASSNIYLFELFDMEAKEINLYIREPIEKNHDNYSYLLNRHKYRLGR